MSAAYSDDQPNKAEKQAVEGVGRYAISQEMLIKMGREGTLLVRERDMKRYIKEIRSLDGISTNWIAAAWAFVGIAVSLAGISVTVPGQLLIFGMLAFCSALSALICFVANRQVNQQRKDAAEELAKEMEEAEVDQVEIVPVRSPRNTSLLARPENEL
jgi:hypothetical protein